MRSYSNLLSALNSFVEATTAAAKSRVVRPMEATLHKDMRRAFTAQGAAFLDGMAALAPLWESRRLAREAVSKSDWLAVFDDAAKATYAAYLDPLQRTAITGLAAGAASSFSQLEIAGSFDLKNPRAVQYVQAHGAAMVTNINNTTRSYLNTVITRSVREGWSYSKTAAEIKNRYSQFAVGVPQQHIRSRAELIAVTESGEAYEAGSEMPVRDLVDAGLQMQKSWLTVGDERVDPDCAANEAEGWIAFDEPFSDGHMRAMAHPACRCTTLYRRAPAAKVAAPAGPTTALEARGKLAEIDRQYNEQYQQLLAENDAIKQEIETISAEKIGPLVRHISTLEVDSPAWEAARAEVKALQAERAVMYERATAIQERHKVFIVERAKAMRAPLYVENPAQVKYKMPKGVDKAVKASWQDAGAEFNQMVDGGIIQKDEAEVKLSRPRRAFYSPTDKAIHMNQKVSGPSTYVHEMGHWLEDQNDEVHQKTVAFLQKRTAGEAPEWMGAGYAGHELTRKDKFLNKYMGVDYSVGKNIYATEIVSMGLQYFFENPSYLAANDPEYFDFIYNVVRGL